MQVRITRVSCAVSIAVVLFGSSLNGGESRGVPSRTFEFMYQVHVPALPADSAPLYIWIPLPRNDAYQTIAKLRIESPVAYKIEREAEYGNRLAYFDVGSKQAAAPFDIVVRFQATRREHRVDLSKWHDGDRAQDAPLSQTEMARYLQADRLVPLNGMITELSRQVIAGARNDLEKARRIFDYVVATMRYDKSGEGWGRGDAIFACTAKRGNCTDFHALFIGMMRAAGIPARFEIGFPLPEDTNQGEIPGYHCWAEFYLKGFGWVPVDASEARQHPEKRDYFFGAHDNNRVLFTYGRDLRLNPSQKGDPVNYFIYPYAEQSSQAFDRLRNRFSFRNRRENATRSPWEEQGKAAEGSPQRTCRLASPLLIDSRCEEPGS